MVSGNKRYLILIGAMLVVVLVLGVFVFRGGMGGEVDAFDSEVTPSASAAESEVSSSPSVSASSEFETYVLADGECKTAEGVDYSDPDAVATRFMEISYCFDSMVDSTMTAGMLRASDLMTDGLKERLKEPERNALQNQWVLAVDHQAYTRPRVSDNPAEQMVFSDSSRLHRSKMVSWLWVGRDDSTMDGGYSTLDLVLVQGEDGRWLVDEAATGVFEPQ